MTTCEYRLLNLLAEGTQSKVFLAENTTDLKKYALKLFHRNTHHNTEEIEQASKTQHESIISLKQRIESVDSLSFSDLKSEDSFTSADFIGGFAMELAAYGDFLNLVSNLGALPEVVARSYAIQLVDALEALSTQGVSHRNLELANLLLDENYCLKLADFGAAKTAGVRRGEEEESVLSSDAFALGVIIFELVCGYSPFAQASLEDDCYRLVAEGNWEEFWMFHEEVCQYNHIILGSEIRELIESLMNSDAEKRPTIAEIKNSKWMKKISIGRMAVGSWIQEIAKKKKANSVLSMKSSL